MNTFEWLRAQAWARWVVLGVASAIVVSLGLAGWTAWRSRHEAQGSMALAQARPLVAQAQAPGASVETRERAAQALQGVIGDFPRSSSAAQATYLLGGLRFAAGQYAQARSSFELARAQARSASLVAAAGLDIGYCWEAERNYGAAEKTYLSLVNGAKTQDFLYEEALLGAARVQELAGKPGEALATYERLLKDVPGSRREDEIRSRVANLQTHAKP